MKGLILPSSLYCLLIVWLIGSAGATPQDQSHSWQRKMFLVTEQAIKHKKPLAAAPLKKLLRGYILYPYLEYEEKKSQLDTLSNAEITAFLDQYQGTVVANKLRQHWLNHLARKKRWADYADFYVADSSTTRRCHYVNALIHTDSRQQAFSKIRPLWLYGRSRPSACDPAFKSWQASADFSKDMVWQRIQLAMAKNNIELARYLGSYLDKQDKRWLDSWLKVHQTPGKVLSEKVFQKDHPYKNEILAHAAYRAVVKDSAKGTALWKRIQRRYRMDEMNIHLANRKIARHFVRDTDPAAYKFIVSVEPCAHDTDLQTSRIRAALYRQDWTNALAWLRQLPEDEQSSERWRYWQARALAETGGSLKANKIYRELAAERSYYGFMAADYKSSPYKLTDEITPVSAEAQARIDALPAVKRAAEFIVLDRWASARSEWRYVQQGLSKAELMAAAKLADSWGWHDQAIFTLAKTGYWDDLKLRFPVKHLTRVKELAKSTDLNPAWVYGVIRQESAFNPEVVSHAGAVGLMQLMPGTARLVARSLKQKKPSKRHLTNPNLNIQLGTNYLRMVLDKLDSNPVLATAAYNAGPHRVQRWLPEKNLPADIWIELIPFKETRTYVQRVFTYAAIYDYRLKQKNERLSQRMPKIIGSKRQAKSGSAPKVAKL